jgi:PAS domain S-box-containing protein
MTLESSISPPSAAPDPGQVVSIPDRTVEKWQTIVDTMAALVNVPAGLVMRINGAKIECLIASRTPGNPYHPGDSEHLLGSGLYCEAVINTQKPLLIANALTDPHWQHNPDVKLNMISYLGFPLLWPDAKPFGTICVLDCKGNSYSDTYKRLIEQFRDLIEHHLALIYNESTGRQKAQEQVRQSEALLNQARQREADLVASEARLRMAQTRTGVGIWDRDLRSDALSLTPELEEIYGLEAKSVRTYSDFRDRVHPDDLENLEACRDDAIRKRERYLHEFRIIRPSGEVRWVLVTGSAIYDQITGEPIRILGNNVDITERKRAEERQKTLMAELDHRVKNVLARVAMIAASTRKESTTIDQYVSSLQGRVQSMAVAHSLLSQSRWENVGLSALVEKQLAPHATGSNVMIKGEDITLGAAEVQAVAMVLHELVTNAAKYGSLCVPGGRVCITWERVNPGTGAKLLFEWRELGGPTVPSKPQARYGTSLIRDLIPHELGGTVDLVFPPDGVRCKIEIILERDESPAYCQESHPRDL